jgi:valyl-tRNA synthetase
VLTITSSRATISLPMPRTLRPRPPSTLSSRAPRLPDRSLSSTVSSRVCRVSPLLSSLLANRFLTPCLPVPVIVHANDDKTFEMFQKQVAVISSLTKGCKSAEVVRQASEVPEGCATQTITPEVAINIMVRGKIDIDAEVSKIQKKVDHIQTSATKLKGLQATNSKLPAEVQAANVEKVRLSMKCLFFSFPC